MQEPEILNTEDRNGDEVKIYASDSGHKAEAPLHHPGARERLAEFDARCREQVVLRPWTALAVASLAGGALGVLAGVLSRRRH